MNHQLAAEKKDTRYFAVLVRYVWGKEWRLYACNGSKEAIGKADNISGVIEVMQIREITREQYETGMRRIKKLNGARQVL